MGLFRLGSGLRGSQGGKERCPEGPVAHGPVIGLKVRLKSYVLMIRPSLVIGGTARLACMELWAAAQPASAFVLRLSDESFGPGGIVPTFGDVQDLELELEIDLVDLLTPGLEVDDDLVVRIRLEEYATELVFDPSQTTLSCRSPRWSGRWESPSSSPSGSRQCVRREEPGTEPTAARRGS